MGPISMGIYVVSVSRHVLPYMDVPYHKDASKDALHSNEEYLRLDVVHAAA
jgi:hypothetical protein